MGAPDAERHRGLQGLSERSDSLGRAFDNSPSRASNDERGPMHRVFSEILLIASLIWIKCVFFKFRLPCAQMDRFTLQQTDRGLELSIACLLLRDVG
jgi:hypothetical protein